MTIRFVTAALLFLSLGRTGRCGGNSAPTTDERIIYTLLDVDDRILEKFFLNTKYQLSSLPMCLTEHVNDESSSSTTPSPSPSPKVQVKKLNLTKPEYISEVLRNDGAVIKVTFDFSLLQLVAISEKHESVTLSMQTVISWIDCRIAWDPAEFGDTLRSSFSPSKFRKLDMYVPEPRLLEEVDSKASLGTEKAVEYSYDGRMRIVKEYTTTISCNFDVSMYPFDTQACSLTFEMQHNKFLTTLVDDHENVTDWEELAQALLGDGRFMASDSWELIVVPGRADTITVSEGCDSSAIELMCKYDRIAYTLILHRHPTYQLINLMVPAGLVVLISSCVFLIPHRSGDKMGLSLTILLSMFVFTQLMYEKMPETGSTIPLISLFYIVSILLVSVSCIFSAVTTITAASQQPVPRCLHAFAQFFAPLLLCRKLVSSHSMNNYEVYQAIETLLANDGQAHTKLDWLNVNVNGKKPCVGNGETAMMDAVTAESDSDALPSNCNRSSDQCHHSSCNCTDAHTHTHTQVRMHSARKVITWSQLAPLIDRIFFVIHFIISSTVFLIFVSYGYFPWKSHYGGKLPAEYAELASLMMQKQSNAHND